MLKKGFEKDLKLQAEISGINYNQLLTIVAYERAMVRLVTDSKLQESIIFKGGMIMRTVYGSSRFTQDLDASFEGISSDDLKSSVENSLKVDLEDGFSFKKGSWSDITESKEYSGLRFKTRNFRKVWIENRKLAA